MWRQAGWEAPCPCAVRRVVSVLVFGVVPCACVHVDRRVVVSVVMLRGCVCPMLLCVGGNGSANAGSASVDVSVCRVCVPSRCFSVCTLDEEGTSVRNVRLAGTLTE